MQRTRSGFLMLAVTASMLLWASIAVTPAKAASMTFAFDGAVTSIGVNLLGNSSPLGTESNAFDGLHSIHFSGTYGFDTNTNIGVVPLSPNVSVYSDKIFHLDFILHRDALPAQNISAVNYSYNSAVSAPGTIAPQNTIAVGNGAATPGAASFLGIAPVDSNSQPMDSYQVVMSFSGDPVNGQNGLVTASHLEFNYIHNNNNLVDPLGPFSDTSLPTTPPGIDSHSNGSPFRVFFGTGDEASVVNGTILSMHIVANPLPPAVILFGAGLVALIGLGAGSWRQRKTA